MFLNTFRYQARERRPLPMTYWRRRFLALVVGLAILAVIAWAFSGVLAVGGASPAASAGHRSSGRGADTRGAASGVSGGGGASGSAAAPRASTSYTPAALSSPAPPGGPPSASPSPDRAQSAGSASSGLPSACRPGEVVLSLFSSQDSYGHGQLPEFDVDVVSTAARTCAFNVGPKYLALVITARGKRIWSSADCVAGQGSLLTDLARGVPTVLPLPWDRETSAPGCKAASRQVAAGSFAAAASDGGLASNSVTFTLG
jgi:hypothetical protein